MKIITIFITLLLFGCSPSSPLETDQLFLMKFRAADTSDEVMLRMADQYTKGLIRIEFFSDGTYLHESGQIQSSGLWTFRNDSLFWAQSNAYLYVVERDRRYLKDSLFKIELLPLPSR